VAAAVVLPHDFDCTGVDDSKRLSPAARARAADRIRAEAVAWAVAVVEPPEIDTLNIYWAGIEAMRRAVAALSPAPDHLLVDGRRIAGVRQPQTRIVGGDATEPAIAAASILAKQHRDALMIALDRTYPGYGFARHKGYPTAQHREALRRLGPCPAHRLSFPAVQQLAGDVGPLFGGDPVRWRARLLGDAAAATEPDDR